LQEQAHRVGADISISLQRKERGLQIMSFG